MFDTMTLTKVVGGFCGAFLVFLLGGFAAEFIYHEPKHKDGEHHQAYTIDTGTDEPEEAAPEIPFAEVFAAADAGAGERLWRQCQPCHKVEDGANGTGPHLFGVVGRTVGSVAGRVVGVVASGPVSGWTAESWRAGRFVYPAFGAPRPGVGSKATHPNPSNQTSGQAW